MRRLMGFLQTACPTCRLIAPYLNALSKAGARVSGVSQDGEFATREFVQQMNIRFSVQRDPDFELSRRYDVVAVPTLYVVDEHDRTIRQEPGFDKTALNEIAALFGCPPVASPYDGAPQSKPGCTSRHLEVQTADSEAVALNFRTARGVKASTIELADSEDPYEYCYRAFGDPLPVVPPTQGRIDKMLRATDLDPPQV